MYPEWESTRALLICCKTTIFNYALILDTRSMTEFYSKISFQLLANIVLERIFTCNNGNQKTDWNTME